jgi:hypothetical protein
LKVRWIFFGIPLVVALSAAGDEGWTAFDSREGVIYEKRSVAGSRFNEYRAVVAVTSSPAETSRAVWSAITESIPATVKKRTVISRASDEIVVYDQIRTPVVSDRDVTIRIRRVVNGDCIEIRFESANDLGPPPASGFVRLPVVRGKWALAPANSGTRVTYECYSEPGGSIPAFLVRGAQQSEVAKDVERVLAHLARAR